MEIRNENAGRLIKTPRDYFAFIPNAVNPPNSPQVCPIGQFQAILRGKVYKEGFGGGQHAQHTQQTRKEKSGNGPKPRAIFPSFSIVVGWEFL